MSPSTAVRPLFRAGSRLLLEHWQNGLATTASSGRLAAAFGPRPASRPPSICLSCSFTLGRQLRFSSTNTPPPEPPQPPPRKDEPKPEHVSASSSSESAATTEAESSPSETTQPPPPQSPSSPPPSNASQTSNPITSNPSLPSHTESRRSQLSTRFTEFMDRAQSSLFVASQRINDLTGYSGIESLKAQIASLEAGLTRAQEDLHAARGGYKAKVAERASTQREVTTLMARQKTWTPLDFERFTTLYRTDYELEADVAERARDLEEAEREAERLSRELSAGILARYHEEQIWSDKIRRMSTWGTWGLMGVNVLLFLVFQFGAEPWRRARLVKGFEEKVREALGNQEEKERAQRLREWEELMPVFREADRKAAALAPEAATATAASASAAAAAPASVAADPASPAVAEAAEILEETPAPEAAVSWREVLTDPAWWKETAADLTSERKVAIRMRDVSLVALEGVAAGAAIAGSIAILFLRRT
ncbi:hypothetical protein JX266_002048 [Neoarthrinium moseri]|nr:hypothetical protein JX266_002048 [Neoarthrinium moseri]